MRFLTIILIFFTIGCQSSIVNDEYFNIGEEFTLKFGQEKKLQSGGLSVKFDSLITDSRCAIGAVCVWEGEAQIRLKCSFGDNTEENHILKIKGYVKKENTSQHQSISARYFVITLMQLDPYPVQNNPTDVTKYRALLKVQTVER